jgi:hypothetical protein
LKHTFFCPGRFEREANEFAGQLLFDERLAGGEYDINLGRYVREEEIVELVGYRSNEILPLYINLKTCINLKM